MLGARESGTEGNRMTKTGQAMEACQEGDVKVSTETLGLEHRVMRLDLLPPCGVYLSGQPGYRAPSLHFITVVVFQFGHLKHPGGHGGGLWIM